MPSSVLLEETSAGPSFRPSTSRKWLWQVGLLFSLLPLGRWSRTATPAAAVAAGPARAVLMGYALAPFPAPFPAPLVAAQHEVLPMTARAYPIVPRPNLPTAGL